MPIDEAETFGHTAVVEFINHWAEKVAAKKQLELQESETDSNHPTSRSSSLSSASSAEKTGAETDTSSRTDPTSLLK
jgi:hypothetical protein